MLLQRRTNVEKNQDKSKGQVRFLLSATLARTLVLIVTLPCRADRIAKLTNHLSIRVQETV